MAGWATISALDRKVLRDSLILKGQLFAIALVIACGVGLFVAMRATMLSLDNARASYYASQRFADVFVSMKRAPEHLAQQLRDIPGVHRVQTRVVADVTVDVPGMKEAAVGRLVSLPDEGRPLVNDIVLRSGRLPRRGHGDEVLVSEVFAEAHGFVIGAKIAAVINGSWKQLEVVGTAMSPEYTYSLAPGQLFPDDRLFGVIWMTRSALGAAFDMEGAFNNAVLGIARDVSSASVIRRVDAILGRYGGLGAIPRKDQQSAFFLDNELTQLRGFAVMIPILFLGVAALLLNVVIGRVVASQREQIAALKAVGYRDREIGVHFAKLVGIVVVVGCFLGVLLALWLGKSMTSMYAEYYRFPDLPFTPAASDALIAVFVTVGAAGLGTLAAIARTVRIPPAEAMRPESPPVYRASVLERLGLARFVSPAVLMVLREVERKPARAMMSIVGIALATGLTILNSFTADSIERFLNVEFGIVQREDVELTLFEPRAMASLQVLEQLPGVLHAEGYRVVPVRMKNGPVRRNVAITGLSSDTTLQAVLDENQVDVPLPREGLVLSRKLADLLRVSAGDRVHVEVLEGARPVLDLPVSRIADTFVGLLAYMDLSALSRILRETPSFNGALLSIDERHLDDLHAAAKSTPVIAGVGSRGTILRNVRQLLDENLGTWVAISLSFSLVMALGVLYNAARITLAERARELASLRVLGFRRREVGAILIGEIAVLTAIGLPLGLLVGTGFAAIMVESPGFNTEQFRLPFSISPATYALGAASVLIAAVISGWSAWRKLDQIDIVEVLKSRD